MPPGTAPTDTGTTATGAATTTATATGAAGTGTGATTGMTVGTGTGTTTGTATGMGTGTTTGTPSHGLIPSGVSFISVNAETFMHAATPPYGERRQIGSLAKTIGEPHAVAEVIALIESLPAGPVPPCIPPPPGSREVDLELQFRASAQATPIATAGMDSAACGVFEVALQGAGMQWRVDGGRVEDLVEKLVGVEL